METCSTNETGEYLCQYCGDVPMRMTGQELFPLRQDLVLRHYLGCRNCDAWVGCHDRTWKPMGELANDSLRRARKLAHEAFEDMWRKAAARKGWSEQIARSAAYSWVSKAMQCGTHVAGFDLDRCEMVLEACEVAPPDLSPQVRGLLWKADKIRREKLSKK